MTRAFAPKLEILPPAQRRLWPELRKVPAGFVLYGGTAIALHLGHRTSVDFDFFALESFKPDQLYRNIGFLRDSEVVQMATDTLTCIVDRGGPVRFSFFGLPGLGRVSEPLRARDTGLAVAALIDLAGTKAAVVQKRAEAKDYLDLDAIVAQGAVDLPSALAAALHIYGRAFNPQITVKALSYFADGTLPTLPGEVRERLLRAVRAVDLDRLPSLATMQAGGRDRGRK
jgi:Nucleotidyl transferase AbiEii toxin, Type IV TA system